MAPPIPDRWTKYTPIGQRIEGTRFIAFKVPLREHVAESVESKMRLDTSSLLRKIPNLGIIIDLTNTDRYYDPDYFRREGVEHKKLMIPGHVTPPDNLVDQFKLYVMSFLNKNKDNTKLVGVHCTHGVNRTGYLICNFMISEMNMDPKEAIKKFDAARGHHIERRNYLEALDGLLKSKNSKTDRDFSHHHEPDFRHERRNDQANSYHPYRRTNIDSSANNRNRNNGFSFKEDTRRIQDYSAYRNNKPYHLYESRNKDNWRTRHSDNDNYRDKNSYESRSRDNWRIRNCDNDDRRVPGKISSFQRPFKNPGGRNNRDYL